MAKLLIWKDDDYDWQLRASHISLYRPTAGRMKNVGTVFKSGLL